MTVLVDSHSHIYDKAYADDLEVVLTNAREVGVAKVVVCGDDISSSLAALEMGSRHDIVVPTAGVHPHAARDVDGAALDEIARLAALPEVAAVGEIGLDFYRDLSAREDQIAALEAQLTIAAAAGKPACVHSREAEDAIATPLGKYASKSPLPLSGRPAGVMHCFGGTLEQSRRYVDMGFLISLACIVTYPRNDEARRIAMELPLTALLVETDSPYLPPQHIHDPETHVAQVGPVLREQILRDGPGVLDDGVQIHVIQSMHAGRC